MARTPKNQNQGLPLGATLKAGLICSVIVVCCVGYVWEKKQITELSRLTRLAERRRDLARNNNDKLLKRLAELQTPLALEMRVKELKLGLALPQPSQIWRLQEPAVEAAGTIRSQEYAAKKTAAEGFP